jgi:hypothetical protein
VLNYLIDEGQYWPMFPFLWSKRQEDFSHFGGSLQPMDIWKSPQEGTLAFLDLTTNKQQGV